MRKVILVFTDQDDAGNVGVSLEFDPPVMPSDKITPAIGLAFDALQFVKSQQKSAPADEEV